MCIGTLMKSLLLMLNLFVYFYKPLHMNNNLFNTRKDVQGNKEDGVAVTCNKTET